MAEILGIPASTLRFWEKEFTIIKPKRNSKNTRFYTPEDVETIKMVYYLVKEKVESGNYVYDRTQYIAKVTLTKDGSQPS